MSSVCFLSVGVLEFSPTVAGQKTGMLSEQVTSRSQEAGTSELLALPFVITVVQQLEGWPFILVCLKCGKLFVL